ncbi:MAG: NADH-quinone oxidoreductase subunit L [Sulfurospirillum sp.]|nr:NADH-quinone oxidoreductase subunit L [Sulfurospirillum sp.]
MNSLIVFIILIPLLSASVLGLSYMYSIKIQKVPRVFFTAIAVSAPLASLLLGVFFFFKMQGETKVFYYRAYKWLSIDGRDIDMAFMLDALSLFMVLFITFVGWLIHIYASGYMRDDDGYGKFFFYFNLFLASMLLLILADGPLIMFIGWEGVGLCSYLLISFYFEDEGNLKAGNKAFIANRVGDFGFIVGMSILFFYAGTYGFDYVHLAQEIPKVPTDILSYAGIALFVGAMGKSAQIPLFVWLPDAMAGPTPVSALIHAATMVTAGVYMVARFHFLYDLVPHVGLYIAYVGAVSSLFAALIACWQKDIKKILAYSTMSQLGYMFIAVGLGAYSSGLFHVFTHAFFKALLFMGAGAIIIALHHEQDIFKMGGMRHKAPMLFFVMLIATLAICGIPPFAGFFSKDEILLQAFAKQEYLLWLFGVLTAVLTAYYMFRLFFIVFYGSHVNTERVLHPLHKSITYPLIVLAVGSIFVGFLGLPQVLGGDNLIGQWLHDFAQVKPLHVGHTTEFMLMGLNVLAACVGIFIAYKKFFTCDLSIEHTMRGWAADKFYVDELYEKIFIQPYKILSQFIGNVLDLKIIDAVVMNSSLGFIKVGRFVSRMQSANTNFYALMMIGGLSVLCTYFLIVLE